MTRSQIVRNIQKQTTTAPIPAQVIDVVGSRCSVILSTTGRRLHGIPWLGSAPKAGSTVLVDYHIAATPMVIQTVGVQPSADTVSQLPQNPRPVQGDSTALTTNHEDLAGLLGGADNDHQHLTNVQLAAFVDHVITNPLQLSSDTPYDVGATGAPGVGLQASRDDHEHVLNLGWFLMYGSGMPGSPTGSGKLWYDQEGKILYQDQVQADYPFDNVWVVVAQSNAVTKYLEPVTNGDPNNPELVFDENGDVVMAEVNP